MPLGIQISGELCFTHTYSVQPKKVQGKFLGFKQKSLFPFMHVLHLNSVISRHVRNHHVIPLSFSAADRRIPQINRAYDLSSDSDRIMWQTVIVITLVFMNHHIDSKQIKGIFPPKTVNSDI